MEGLGERLASLASNADPGSFAFVMATGILSTGAELVGLHVLSLALLAITLAGLVVLSGALAWRLVRCREDVLSELADSSKAFAFLTASVACEVVAARFGTAGLAAVQAGFMWAGIVIGVAAGYTAAFRVMLRGRAGLEQTVHANWLLVAIAVQGVVTGGAGLLPQLLATGLFGLGVAAYGVALALVIARLVLEPLEPFKVDASLAMTMGAAAISVLAGDGIILGEHLPPIGLAAFAGGLTAFVSGAVAGLWLLGTAWIPLLATLVVWKHAVCRIRPEFEAAAWDAVFPLGMYGVATLLLAGISGFGALAYVGYAFLAIGLCAWLVCALGGLFARSSPQLETIWLEVSRPG